MHFLDISVLSLIPSFLFQKLTSKVQDVVFCKCCKSKTRVTAVDARSSAKHEERNDVYEKQENKNKMNDRDQKIIDKEDSIGSEAITWKEISETLDRMCLYFYSLFVVLLIVMLGAALNGAM